jgi:hypothetical protein
MIRGVDLAEDKKWVTSTEHCEGPQTSFTPANAVEQRSPKGKKKTLLLQQAQKSTQHLPHLNSSKAP